MAHRLISDRRPARTAQVLRRVRSHEKQGSTFHEESADVRVVRRRAVVLRDRKRRDQRHPDRRMRVLPLPDFFYLKVPGHCEYSFKEQSAQYYLITTPFFSAHEPVAKVLLGIGKRTVLRSCSTALSPGVATGVSVRDLHERKCPRQKQVLQIVHQNIQLVKGSLYRQEIFQTPKRWNSALLQIGVQKNGGAGGVSRPVVRENYRRYHQVGESCHGNEGARPTARANPRDDKENLVPSV